MKWLLILSKIYLLKGLITVKNHSKFVAFEMVKERISCQMKSIILIAHDGLFGQLLYFSTALQMQVGSGELMSSSKALEIQCCFFLAIPQSQLKQLPISTQQCQA